MKVPALMKEEASDAFACLDTLVLNVRMRLMTAAQVLVKTVEFVKIL